MDEKEQADRMAAAEALYMISTRGSKDRSRSKDGMATRKSKRGRIKKENPDGLEDVKPNKKGTETGSRVQRGRKGTGDGGSPSARKGGVRSGRGRRGAGGNLRGGGRSKSKSFTDDSISNDANSAPSSTKQKKFDFGEDDVPHKEEKMHAEDLSLERKPLKPEFGRYHEKSSWAMTQKTEAPMLMKSKGSLKLKSETFGFTGASLTPLSEHTVSTPEPTQTLSQNLPSLGLVSGIQQVSIASGRNGSTSTSTSAFSTVSSGSFLPSSNADVVNLPSLPANIHSLQLSSVPVPNLLSLAEVRTPNVDDCEHASREKSQKVLPLKKRKVHNPTSENKDANEGSDNELEEQDLYVASPSRNSPAEPTRATYRVQAPPFLTMQTLMEIKTALTPDEDGDLPLHIAVVHENMRMVTKLIHLMRIAVKGVDKFNKQQQTPLHLAVKLNFIPAVDLLIKSGASINTVDCTGSSAIHMAVQGRFNRCLKLLLNCSSQAELNMRNFEGLTPLHIAVNNGDLEQVQILLKHGGDIDMADGKSGRTALFHAAESNQKLMVEELLKHGANPEFPNYAGITTTMAAQGRSLHGILKLIGSMAQEKTENKWSSFAMQADQDDTSPVTSRQTGQQSSSVLKAHSVGVTHPSMQEPSTSSFGPTGNKTKVYHNVFLVSDAEKRKKQQQTNIPLSCGSQSEPNSPIPEVKREADSQGKALNPGGQSHDLKSLPLINRMKKEILDETETHTGAGPDHRNIVIIKTSDGKLIPLTRDKTGRFVAGMSPATRFLHQETEKVQETYGTDLQQLDRSSPKSVPLMLQETPAVPMSPGPLVDVAINPSQTTSLQARQFQRLLRVCQDDPSGGSPDSKPRPTSFSLPPSASASPLSSLTLSTTTANASVRGDSPLASQSAGKSRILFRSLSSQSDSTQSEEKLPQMISTLSMRHFIPNQKGAYEENIEMGAETLSPGFGLTKQMKDNMEIMVSTTDIKSNSPVQDANLPLNLSARQGTDEASSSLYAQGNKVKSYRIGSSNSVIPISSSQNLSHREQVSEEMMFSRQSTQVTLTGKSHMSSHRPHHDSQIKVLSRFPQGVGGPVASDLQHTPTSFGISRNLSQPNEPRGQSSTSQSQAKSLFVLSPSSPSSPSPPATNRSVYVTKNLMKAAGSMSESVALTSSSNVSSLPILVPLKSPVSQQGEEIRMSSLRGHFSNFVRLKQDSGLLTSPSSTDPIFLHEGRVIDLSQADDVQDLSTTKRSLSKVKPAAGQNLNYVDEGKILGFSGAIISVQTNGKNPRLIQSEEKKLEKQSVDNVVPKETMKRKGKRVSKSTVSSAGEGSLNKINKETDQKLKRFLGLKRNDTSSDSLLTGAASSKSSVGDYDSHSANQNQGSQSKGEMRQETPVVETLGMFSGNVQQVMFEKGYSSHNVPTKSLSAPMKHSLVSQHTSQSASAVSSPQIITLRPSSTHSPLSSSMADTNQLRVVPTKEDHDFRKSPLLVNEKTDQTDIEETKSPTAMEVQGSPISVTSVSTSENPEVLRLTTKKDMSMKIWSRKSKEKTEQGKTGSSVESESDWQDIPESNPQYMYLKTRNTTSFPGLFQDKTEKQMSDDEGRLDYLSNEKDTEKNESQRSCDTSKSSVYSHMISKTKPISSTYKNVQNSDSVTISQAMSDDDGLKKSEEGMLPDSQTCHKDIDASLKAINTVGVSVASDAHIHTKMVSETEKLADVDLDHVPGPSRQSVIHVSTASGPSSLTMSKAVTENVFHRADEQLVKSTKHLKSEEKNSQELETEEAEGSLVIAEENLNVV